MSRWQLQLPDHGLLHSVRIKLYANQLANSTPTKPHNGSYDLVNSQITVLIGNLKQQLIAVSPNSSRRKTMSNLKISTYVTSGRVISEAASGFSRWTHMTTGKDGHTREGTMAKDSARDSSEGGDSVLED